MSQRALIRVSLALGTAALAVTIAPPASAALPNCSATTLSAYRVANVSITSATTIAAKPPDSEYCAVQGIVTTDGEGAGPGAAKFILKLPSVWQNRLVFFGCGGNCGSLKDIGANGTDIAEALGLGYAVVNTDAGHEQNPDTLAPTWNLLAPGVPNTPAIVDFFYRAVHQVTVVTKLLAESYYTAPIARAYFDGCSTGGRQAVMEGGLFPEDFDGLIAGDPIIALDDQEASTIKQAKSFLSPTAYLPYSLLPALDAYVLANCDAADGVADGLIQNPALCSFNPHALVPGTLSEAQADAIELFLQQVVDSNGNPVAPGMVLGYYATAGFEGQAELATPAPDPTGTEPWGGIGLGPNAWVRGDESIRYFVERNPDYDVNSEWPEDGNVISAAAIALVARRTGPGDSDDPGRLHTFLQEGRKIILFHGFSDVTASPYRTTSFYRALARLESGFERLQSGARLFMVPGMGHCKGGPGPNSFDTLRTLDAWVTKGVAPDSIVAATTDGKRTMPLCPFPEEAHYVSGPVDAARSWACDAKDTRLLETGADGALAGADVLYGPVQ